MIQGSRDHARRGAGAGTVITAGLLGGLVGAGLLYGFQTWRPPAAGADPRVGQLEQQLGTLARQDNLRALEGRLGALETAQAGIAQRVQAAQTLAERSAARAEEAANRQAPAAAPQNDAAATDLSNRVTSLETQLRERVEATTGAAQALEGRLAEQEQRLVGATQPLERRLGELDQRLAGVTQPLERRLSEQEQRLAGLVQPLDRRMAEQEQRLSALAQQVAGGGSEATRAGTRVVLADRLANALREGAPYAEVLAGLRRFTPDAGKLAPLDPFAQGGAPTPEALAQSFRPIGERLRRDARQGSEDWTDRLVRMSEKIVTVRTPNDSQGTGVSGIVSQIEDALERRDLAGAAAAWDSLPEPARQASAAWGQQVKQRAAAEAAARGAAADAVAALNQATR